MDANIPLADARPGVPHPHSAPSVIGHDSQADAFLGAFAQGKMHHAWMLTGPEGVGKATFAYEVARFLLATPPEQEDGLFGTPPPPETLTLPEDHPVRAQVAAGAHPALFVLRRGLDDTSREPKLKTAITVGEARKLKDFLALSSADGGHRVVIIDAADEMNTAAANAILKLLEEPPKHTVFLMVCHRPTRILPTIRSRCRTLAFAPLSDADLEAALTQAGLEVGPEPAHLFALADGSVGRAAGLLSAGGLERYAQLVSLLARAPGMDRAAWTKLGESFSGRAKAQDFDMFEDQIGTLLSRIARAGVILPDGEAAPGERDVAMRLAPDGYRARAWADLTQEIVDRLRHGRAVNLDPAALVLDTGLKIDQLAARLAATGAR